MKSGINTHRNRVRKKKQERIQRAKQPPEKKMSAAQRITRAQEDHAAIIGSCGPNPEDTYTPALPKGMITISTEVPCKPTAKEKIESIKQLATERQHPNLMMILGYIDQAFNIGLVEGSQQTRADHPQWEKVGSEWKLKK